MASPHTALTPPPTRFVDRRLRADAERAFEDGMEQLEVLQSALRGCCAHDTAGGAQILLDLLGPGTAKLEAMTRLLRARASLR